MIQQGVRLAHLRKRFCRTRGNTDQSLESGIGDPDHFCFHLLSPNVCSVQSLQAANHFWIVTFSGGHADNFRVTLMREWNMLCPTTQCCPCFAYCWHDHGARLHGWWQLICTHSHWIAANVVWELTGERFWRPSQTTKCCFCTLERWIARRTTADLFAVCVGSDRQDLVSQSGSGCDAISWRWFLYGE